MANVTNIPAPRIGFIDQRTGLMSREWYRFFLNLFTLTGMGTTDVSLADLQISPDPEAIAARYDEAMKLIDGLYTLPSYSPPDTIKQDSNTVLAWLSVQ